MAEQLVVGPTSHYYASQRLRLHYVDWGNHHKPLMVLIHGTLDHARSWDWVALALRDEYHVVAPDLRGHGDSEWARGSEYSMLEYVTDLSQLLTQVNTFPVTLIGHSLGAGIALQYGGVFPENVARLVAVEGLGPSLRMMRRQQVEHAHERIRHWIAQNASLASRQPRRYKTLDEAVQRTREAHPRLTQEQAYHLTFHGTNRNEDGTYTWKFDNFVRARSAYPFRVEETVELWSRITCPTLLLNGGGSFVTRVEHDERLRAFRNAQVQTVPKANHWVHHDQLEGFLRVVRGFLGVPRD